MCFQNNIHAYDKNHLLHFVSRIQQDSPIEIQSQNYFHKAKKALVHIVSSIHQINPKTLNFLHNKKDKKP